MSKCCPQGGKQAHGAWLLAPVTPALPFAGGYSPTPLFQVGTNWNMFRCAAVVTKTGMPADRQSH